MKKWVSLLWLCLIGLAVWVLWDRLREIDAAEVVAQLLAQPPALVTAGLACSAGVYLLVGLYEGIALRIATGRRLVLFPLRTAVTANPIGRAIGAAILSGGALRYRMYSAIGLSAKQIGGVILLVAMPFLIGVGWLVDLSLLLHLEQASEALRLPSTTVLVLGALGLMKDIGWPVFIALHKRPLIVRGKPINLPGLRDTLIQTAFGVAQLSLMTATLYVFMPAELGMSWPAFVAVYCLAFVAGQLSNVPAGLGVLEAALLLLLPHVPPAKLLGAVLAYRAVYELAPLFVAVLLLVLFETTHPRGWVRRSGEV